MNINKNLFLFLFLAYGSVLQWMPDAWGGFLILDKRKDLIPKTINKRLQTKKRQQMNKNGKKKKTAKKRMFIARRLLRVLVYHALVGSSK